MQKKLSILSLTNAVGFAGGEARILSFANTIDRSRFEHRVACIKRLNLEQAPEDAAMRAQFASAGVELFDLGQGYTHVKFAKFLHSMRVLISSVRRLSEFVRKYGVDIIDAHQPEASLVAVLSAKATGIKAAVTGYEAANWIGTLELESKLSAALVVASWQLAYSLADVVITDSDVRRDEIRGSLIRKKGRMSVIPNGVAPPLSERSVDEMRRIFGMPRDTGIRVIGQVGRLVPYKGYMQLLDAARLVLNDREDVFFLIVGHVRQLAYKRQLEQRILELDISDHVRIVSYPGPIADVWKAIDVHAHASLFDSLPNSIIEGMSLAKPAAVTAIGGIPTMVEHNITGLLVPPNDPVALSKALGWLVNNWEAAKRLGCEAQKRYQRRYTAEAMSRAIEHLFVDVCSKHYGRLYRSRPDIRATKEK